MAQTAEVMENQAQEFIDYATKKGFTISQEFIDSVIAELKAVGLFRESISLKTYKMGLASAIDSGKIAAPVMKPIDIVAAAEQLSSRFPTVVTIKKVRKESSTDYTNRQSGRVTAEDRKAEEEKINQSAQKTRQGMQNQRLRIEYKQKKAAAEMLAGRTHAQSFELRRVALQDLNNDPQYARVRDSQ